MLPSLPAQLIVPPDPPPEPVPDFMAKPGHMLSRSQRHEKALYLMAKGETQAQPQLHKTSNGTVVAQPWQVQPRKKITARAENDLEKVELGKMTRAQWIKKHGYSFSLLEKRLQLRAGKGIVPGYTKPSDQLKAEHFERVLGGEISMNKLAHELGVPTGTFHRLLEEYRKTKPAQLPKLNRRPLVNVAQKEMSVDGRRSKTYSFDEADLVGILERRLTKEDVQHKLGCSRALVYTELSKYAKDKGWTWEGNMWHPPQAKQRSQAELFNEAITPPAKAPEPPKPVPSARAEVVSEKKVADIVGPPKPPPTDLDMFDRLSSAIA